MSDENSALENTVKDAYIIRAGSKELTAAERQQCYTALLQRAEELQQQYGAEKFTVTRKFELVPAVAAVIKDEGLVELLKNEGYAVERQGRMDSKMRQDKPQNQNV